MLKLSEALDTSELISALGYVTKPPKISGLGYALMKASKEHPEKKWLKRHLDKVFQKLRRENAQRNGHKK